MKLIPPDVFGIKTVPVYSLMQVTVMDYRSLTSGIDIFHEIFTRAKQLSIYILDLEGRVIDCNKVAEDTFGYVREEIRGRYFDFLFTEVDKQRNKPWEELNSVLTTGKSLNNNYIVHRGGYFKWVNGESLLLMDNEGRKVAIIKTIYDLNEQKRLVHLLEDATNFTENVFDTISGSLLVLDNNFNILQGNKYFYNEFQLSHENIEGRPVFGLCNGQLDSNELRNLLRAAMDNDISFKEFEISIDFPEKGKRIMSLDGRRVNINEIKVQRILLGLVDVTERREIETRKDDFMSMASHELKTPLTGIKAYMQLLETEVEQSGSEKGKNYLQKCNVQLGRLEQLIASLLDVSKIRAGKLQLHIESLDLDQLVKDVVEGHQVFTNHKIILSGSTGKMIKADRVRLEQVFINLLSNAIKYSPKATEVHVRLATAGSQVKVSFEDFGVGIPAETIHDIFDRFFRAESSSRFQGLGIGLYIAREIVERHGGKIEVESRYGHGSVFTIVLPVS